MFILKQRIVPVIRYPWTVQKKPEAKTLAADPWN
jgi:hypothetical protein